jgi:RNA polymerase sigma-70 factor (ECF subfamily)
MDSLEIGDRLSQIRTHWSALLGKHETGVGTGTTRNQLIDRYLGAVYRYLLGAVRDPDLASELCQEFALRFLRGDFRGAQPDRGRFRDYVKTVLVNLVNDTHRRRQNAPVQVAELHNFPSPARNDTSAEPDFAASWREELLACNWDSLRNANPTYFTVLWLRVEEPDLQSPEMAKRLSVQLGRTITPDNVRKSLERAQAKFAELLFDEVGRSLETTDLDRIEAELLALDLLRYCRTTWERRRAKRMMGADIRHD